MMEKNSLWKPPGYIPVVHRWVSRMLGYHSCSARVRTLCFSMDLFAHHILLYYMYPGAMAIADT